MSAYVTNVKSQVTWPGSVLKEAMNEEEVEEAEAIVSYYFGFILTDQMTADLVVPVKEPFYTLKPINGKLQSFQNYQCLFGRDLHAATHLIFKSGLYGFLSCCVWMTFFKEVY